MLNLLGFSDERSQEEDTRKLAKLRLLQVGRFSTLLSGGGEQGFSLHRVKGPALSILTIPCTLVEASKGHSIVELGTRRSSFPATKLYDLEQIICITFTDQ